VTLRHIGQQERGENFCDAADGENGVTADGPRVVCSGVSEGDDTPAVRSNYADYDASASVLIWHSIGQDCLYVSV
jgi:hypothetical protein